MRDVLAVVVKGSQEMVASIIRTIFAQPDAEHIQKQLAEVTAMLGRSHPKVAAMLTDADANLLSFSALPRRHWRQIGSTNPLEGVNEEIKRRHFSEASVLELATMNKPIEVLNEAVMLREVAAAKARTIDPRGVEKPHHSAGRDPNRSSRL